MEVPQVIPAEAVEAAMIAFANAPLDPPTSLAQMNLNNQAQMTLALEAAAPHMMAFGLAAEYRRGYRDGLTDRKQVTADQRDWEPGDPIE